MRTVTAGAGNETLQQVNISLNVTSRTLELPVCLFGVFFLSFFSFLSMLVYIGMCKVAGEQVTPQ